MIEKAIQTALELEKEYLNLKEIMVLTNLKETSIRKYINLYRKHMDVKREGGKVVLNKKDLHLLKKIYNYFDQGYSEKQIHEILMTGVMPAHKENYRRVRMATLPTLPEKIPATPQLVVEAINDHTEQIKTINRVSINLHEQLIETHNNIVTTFWINVGLATLSIGLGITALYTRKNPAN